VLGKRFYSTTTHMREWSKADRYVAPDLAGIQALIGGAGSMRLCSLIWRHMASDNRQDLNGFWRIEFDRRVISPTELKGLAYVQALDLMVAGTCNPT
jgi:hypothetical protein